MKLIGMLDSPYVRRSAISLHLLGVDFDHMPLSVFSTFDEFKAINPVVKAPTLVLDDGTVLMDSTLIIDYAEHASGRTLMPDSLEQRRQATAVIGLALAACEKTVQIVYERNLRPAEKQHEPWVTRVQGQLDAAYAALEAALQQTWTPAQPLKKVGQFAVTAAVAWRFTQALLPGTIQPQLRPGLAQLSAQAEALPAFQAFPHA
ncbi:glutathione S-transferase [Achromobacter insuavis]|uniref:glutathione S-transferase n=1 Tax=Achromobacter insuavis TaxID=1287735 RepID=UPI001F1368A1